MNARFIPAIAGCLLPLSPHLMAGAPGPKEPVPPPLTPAPPASAFRLSAGWMHRSLGGVDFHSGSRAQHFTLPALLGPPSRQLPAIGSPDAASNRFYADGFLRPDAGTPTDGTTAHWGYTQTSQIQGDFLDFHATGSRTETATTTAFTPADTWGLDTDGGAPVLALDWSRPLGPLWTVGLQTQWSFLGFDDSHQSTNFQAVQSATTSRLQFTDRYSLHGLIPPAAPYQGSDAGRGPLLDALPASRSLTESLHRAESATVLNHIHETLDVDTHTLSLGPTLQARLGPTDIQLAAGLAVTIAEWNASHSESLTVSRPRQPTATLHQWQDENHDTELLPGFYLQAAVALPLTPRLSVSGFSRYDWSRSLEGTVGPSSFSVDLNGWSLGVLLSLSF